jgi:transcriptional regulator with XRE-family HTH domain
MGQLRDELLLEKISQKIKTLRKAKGVTLEEFFNDTNIHLSRIEHSKANLTVSTLKEICKYFGISLHEFFRDVDR